jgi:hypothetical protein
MSAFAPCGHRHLTTRDAEARGVLFDSYAKVAYSIALACSSLGVPDGLEFEDNLHSASSVCLKQSREATRRGKRALINTLCTEYAAPS